MPAGVETLPMNQPSVVFPVSASLALPVLPRKTVLPVCVSVMMSRTVFTVSSEKGSLREWRRRRNSTCSSGETHRELWSQNRLSPPVRSLLPYPTFGTICR